MKIAIAFSFFAAISLLCFTASCNGKTDLSRNSQQTLRQMFLNKLAASQVNLPGNTVCEGCLMSSVTAGSDVVKGVGSVEEMTAKVQQRLFPSAAVERLRVMAYAASTKFQLINFNIATSIRIGRYENYLAAARRVNGKVEFGIIRGIGLGRMVRKYNVEVRRECKIVVFVKQCKNKTYYIPRGYTPAEIALIEQAFRHHTHKPMLYMANTAFA